MKAIVCGAGRMGTTIGFALRKLGYDLVVVEEREKNADKFASVNGSWPTFPSLSHVPRESDILISSLPYYCTEFAADWCINNGVRYCDLGGSVSVSKKIKKTVESVVTSKPVMTDLGLAPGWVNIIAEELYHLMPKMDSLTMMVGGIPIKPADHDPLKYSTTWSVEGLLNEYRDDCVSLVGGKKLTHPSLINLESVVVDGMLLEAFSTSGASSHTIDVMMDRGVKNCTYKTLRWPGHCKIISYLLAAAKNDDYLADLLTSFTYPDLVAINVIARCGSKSLTRSLVIYGKDGFSAMQRATAFPIVSVANQLAKGMLDEIKYPVYSNINLEMFNNDLDFLLD